MENSEVKNSEMKIKKTTKKVYIKGINFLTPKIKQIHKIKVEKNKVYFSGNFMGVFIVKEITDNKHFTSHLLSPFDKGIVPAFFNTVNSMHHQAVKNVGLLLAVTSTFNNCIESTENKQIITTQFHPETMPSVFTDNFFKYIYAWSKTKK